MRISKMVYHKIDGKLYGMKTGEGMKCKKCSLRSTCQKWDIPRYPCIGLAVITGANFYFTQDFISELLKALNEKD